MALNKWLNWLKPVPTAEDPPLSLPPGLGTLSPEIYVILRRAFVDHCPLTVYINDRPEAYTSAILEIVPEQAYLVLDELTPTDGHNLLLTEPRISVRAIVEGIELHFATRVTQFGEQDGLPYYRVEFPKFVDYAQRRCQYRVMVPLNQGFEVSFDLSDERQLLGELRDLSVGGLCARIRSGELQPKIDARQIASCRILLPSQQSIVMDVELLAMDATVRSRVPRLRTRFIDLSPTAARRVAQLCAEIERLHRQLR